MSVKPIRLFGDPVLRTPAEPVRDFEASKGDRFVQSKDKQTGHYKVVREDELLLFIKTKVAEPPPRCTEEA